MFLILPSLMGKLCNSELRQSQAAVKPVRGAFTKISSSTFLGASRTQKPGELKSFDLWCGKLSMLVLFGLFWPGFHEGTGAAASSRPAAPGGAAEDHGAAALVPQPALQETVPEPAARGHQHTGGCCCWIPVHIGNGCMKAGAVPSSHNTHYKESPAVFAEILA